MYSIFVTVRPSPPLVDTILFRLSLKISKTCLLGRGFHTLISNVSFLLQSRWDLTILEACLSNIYFIDYFSNSFIAIHLQSILSNNSWIHSIIDHLKIRQNNNILTQGSFINILKFIEYHR